MIDTNLSTRPFYNERAVTLVFAVVGLIALAATAWNVTSVLRYSGSSTELASKASRGMAVADMRPPDERRLERRPGGRDRACRAGCHPRR